MNNVTHNEVNYKTSSAERWFTDNTQSSATTDKQSVMVAGS